MPEIKNNSNQVKLLYPFKNSTYQHFLQDFADSLIKEGFQSFNGPRINWTIRHLAARLKIQNNLKQSNPIIVLGGGYIDASAFPYGYCHEIIPVLWDTWPKYWDRLISSMKRLKINLAFFTQSQTLEYVSRILPGVKCYYIPEGLSSDGYVAGDNLENRIIDVLELGRVHNEYHRAILGGDYCVVWQDSDKLLFPTQQSLCEGLSNSKVVINFPRCMSHPEHAGGVETLTQRYWECMLSRSLMIGHAPKELVDLIGYNPVVEVEWGNEKNQLEKVLSNISSYQSMVDHNYYIALTKSRWDTRITKIIEILQSNGYSI